MNNDLITRHRGFLKDTLRKEYDFSLTDQHRGIPAPLIQKPYNPEAPRIPLLAPPEFKSSISDTDLLTVVIGRESRRHYLPAPLSLSELSFLLFSTQGIRHTPHPSVSLRTVPSAGARHSFETYLLVRNVQSVDPGLYRYLPLDHTLAHLGDRIPPSSVIEGCLDQRFTGECSVTFIWTVIPYRTEWRYGPVSHKIIAIDAGHVCQNLYLACTASGLGSCAIGAYDQDIMDTLLHLDGSDEFVIYIAPVGRM
ncbi:MAG: SagB/ThcOx family dehydrogenase [Candidatus Aegiribacteria sp.]|nr:SagB/ThcOx family dehydrogenase [Candidatus Aegiribacteria sp.]